MSIDKSNSVWLPDGRDPGMVGRIVRRDACGCRVMVGIRTDIHETATAAVACKPEHAQFIERFNLAMADSLVNPRVGVPLVDVVDEILNALPEEAP